MAPLQLPGNYYGTEVFQLNTNLLAKVLELTTDTVLIDSDPMMVYRKKYPFAPGNAAPTIVQCDVATSDVWFTGSLLSEGFDNITSVWTNGTGKYCTTAEEDNATLEAALRAHHAGKVDYWRFILLRSVSDFDRESPIGGDTAYENLFSDSGAFVPSLQNLHVASAPII
eukprot:gene1628-1896_t